MHPHVDMYLFMSSLHIDALLSPDTSRRRDHILNVATGPSDPGTPKCNDQKTSSTESHKGVMMDSTKPNLAGAALSQSNAIP